MAFPNKFKSVFETYRRQRQLGQGGAGAVFEVIASDGVAYALKTLKPTSVTVNRVQRFKNELRFGERVVHPNIVRVHDYGFWEAENAVVPFYVMMKYGGTLRGRIPAQDGNAALSLLAGILDGLEAAHLQGVWHRDLKPENILISDGPVIADFGIAHFAESLLATAVETQDQERLANFVYAAPEQRQLESVDARSDLFAVGLMLNELFTGRVPLGADYQRIGEVSNEHGYLDPIVEKLISQNPDRRYQDVGELKRAISAAGAVYLAEQKVREMDAGAVPKHTPESLPDIAVVTADIKEQGQLVLELNAAPPRDWVDTFRAGNYGHNYSPQIRPQRVTFSGANASITGEPRDLQLFVDSFRSWVPTVTEIVRRERAKAASDRDREALKLLRENQEREQARLEALRNLKL